MTAELKQCPFCGASARLKSRKTHIAECTECPAFIISVKSEEDAASVWNRREEQPVAAQQDKIAEKAEREYWAKYERAAHPAQAPQQEAGQARELLAELDWCIENGNTGPRSHKAIIAARAALASAPAQPTVPEGMLQRVKAAAQRIANNQAPRRIPADPTDVDLVLAEVQYWIEGTWPPFWIAAAAPVAQGSKE